jgi:hypothetical protein
MTANACSRKHDVGVPSDRERVDADASLLAAARRRYAGRGDVADQLWWLEHPGTRSPSGADDPAPALEAARAQLYRPGGSSADPEALRSELAAVTADREAARAALREAEEEAERSASAPDRPSRLASPARLLIGVALAALLAGAGVGLAVGRFGRAPSPAALARFDAGQRTADRPPSTAVLPTFVTPSSFRLLGSSSSTGVFAYGARAPDGRVCVIAVVLAQASYAACTSEAAFAVSGLELSLRANADPTDDSGAVSPVEISPRWSPDGAFTF